MREGRLPHLLVALGLAALGALVGACGGSGPAASEFQEEVQVSECGGFVSLLRSPLGDRATYCDAEVLNWAYDVEAGRLNLANNRVLLNCCGEHEMTVAHAAGTFVVTEIDAPGAGRCRCDCVFDYTVSFTGTAGWEVPLRLVRDVTDSGAAPAVVWEGTLDLTQGAGQIVIDTTDVSAWCATS
jgi:hypothetical protein